MGSNVNPSLFQRGIRFNGDKGIAGVPGVSFVVLLATLGTVGIPLEGLAFVAGIDRILDMARTVVNVVGNSLATVVISKWEGRFETEKEKEEKYFSSTEEKLPLFMSIMA